MLIAIRGSAPTLKRGFTVKMLSKSTVLAGVTAALLGFSVSAAATVDPNDPNVAANWTQVPDTGSISINVAPPDFVTLIGSNIGDNAFHNTSFTIAAPSAATVSFNWHYVTADIDPFWDMAYFVKGNTQSQLPVGGSGSGGVSLDQSGSSSFSVGGGQVFGFSVVSVDGLGGAATLTISNFQFQASPVPEPGSLAMLTVGLMVVAAARKRKRS